MNNNKKLSAKEVRYIARLANLYLSEDEVEKFRRQLSEILDYIEMLSKVDIKNVKPTSQVTGLSNVTKEDVAGVSLSQKEAIAASKQTHNGFIKVKAIFND